MKMYQSVKKEDCLTLNNYRLNKVKFIQFKFTFRVNKKGHI